VPEVKGGGGNKKIGNAHLAVAFGEAGLLMLRCHEPESVGCNASRRSAAGEAMGILAAENRPAV